ncbi:MAG: serine/threonine-protein kinase [Labilithrix sp.]
MDRGPSGWIGSVLDNRWRIDAKIARGGVATVYKGFDLQTSSKVAVKIMHPEFSRNQDARGRFLREGYVANKVGHPLVVKVLADAALPDSTVFLVMELLEEGELLEARRERLGGKMSVEEAVRIGDQILDVLVAAHNQDIVHRDIKPENIFLLPDGTVKVLDFGIAHIKEGVMKGGESTATGLLLGTPDFMSPEQAMGMRGTIDAASDIYAVGATIFTLITGEAVHTDMNLAALLHSTSTKQARSLAAARNGPSLPRELIAVIDKALMLQKTQRWPSARAMQNALHQAVPSAFKSAVPESSKTRPFSPIDIKASAAVRASGKAPRPSATPRDGVKVPSLPPISEGVPTPREASPWEQDFEDGDMEGPTVATNEFPALKKAPPPPADVRTSKLPTIEPEDGDLSDIHTTQAMTGELLAAVAPLVPAPPPPKPVSLPPPQPHMQTGSIPPPPPAGLFQTGPHMQGHGSMPPPAPHHGSMPPPFYSPSQPPPPPFMGPPTPRHQQWGQTDSGGAGIVQQQAPSIPPPLAAPMSPSKPKRTGKAAPSGKKPPSIVIAEIVLALLVVVTLTIGGCLLLESR